MDPNVIISVLNNQLASDAYQVKSVSTPDLTLSFRPITTIEQKKLSKLILPVQTNSFAETYAISMGLIKSTAINPESIDFKKLTELDRIIIISEFLTRNYTIPTFNVPCNIVSDSESNKENKKQRCNGNLGIKFTAAGIIKKMEAVKDKYFKDQEVTIENKTGEVVTKYIFTINYPSIDMMYQFEKMLDEQNSKDQSQKFTSDIDRLEIIRKRTESIVSNEVFPLIFIRKLRVLSGDNEIVNVDLTAYTLENIIQIFESIPLYLFTNEENGLNTMIQNEFIMPMFKYTSVDITCPKCKKEYTEVMSFYAFFI